MFLLSLPTLAYIFSKGASGVRSVLPDWAEPIVGAVLVVSAIGIIVWQFAAWYHGEARKLNRNPIAFSLTPLVVGVFLLVGSSLAAKEVAPGFFKPPPHDGVAGLGPARVVAGPDRDDDQAVRAKKPSGATITASAETTALPEASDSTSSGGGAVPPTKSCGCPTGGPPSVPQGGGPENSPPAREGGGAVPSGEGEVEEDWLEAEEEAREAEEEAREEAEFEREFAEL